MKIPIFLKIKISCFSTNNLLTANTCRKQRLNLLCTHRFIYKTADEWHYSQNELRYRAVADCSNIIAKRNDGCRVATSEIHVLI